MGYVGLSLRIVERLFFMFLHGEKLTKIKAACLVDYANFQQDRKNLGEAMNLYEKAIKLYPTNYYAYAGLAAIFIEKRNFKDALHNCQKAFSIKKNGVLLQFQFAIIYEALKESSLAEEALRNTLRYCNNDLAAAYNKLAYMYLQFGMFDEAERSCRQAINLRPSDSGLYNNLAKIYLAQERFEDAKNELQRVLELSADKSHKKSALGQMELIRKRMSGAEKRDTSQLNERGKQD